LVTGTALAHLGARLGHEAVIADLEEKLASGQVSDREVAEAYALAYRDVAESDAMQAMLDIESIIDISAGVALLNNSDVETIIATVSWKFAAQSLAERWGFELLAALNSKSNRCLAD